MRISVQPAPFDPGAELSAFTAKVAGAGAVVSFTGLVRDESSRLSALMIEHYSGMTDRAIAMIVNQAHERWHLLDAWVIHRYGMLRPHEAIMMIATAAAHRADAFQAAEFLMDYLKSRAPFWKKEITATGETWVTAKDTDEDALNRWR